MKPSFALQFTDTGITLLHRTGRGWLPLGDAALDDPALGDNLGYLRATALGLEPQGITTKLVIPNDQILYTKVAAPGPEAGKRRNQIRKALEGRTPYGVDDLLFDWSGNGAEVMVAVIARETLAEAEAFAASHRFNPMSFVALPDPATFDGEPFFGPSAHAATALADGDKVERDRPALRIIARGDAARAAAARAALAETDLPLAATAPAPEPQVAGFAIAEPTIPEPEVVAANSPDPVAPDAGVEVHPAPEPVAAMADPEPAAAPPVEWQPASIIAGTAPDLDLLPDTDADLAPEAPVAAVKSAASAASPAPSFTASEAPAARFGLAASSADVPEAPAMFDVPMDDGDIPAMPHAVVAATFSSRRNGVASRLDGSASESAAPPRLGPVVPTPAVTAPSLPTTATAAVESPVSPPARSGSKSLANGKVADPRAKLAASGKNGAAQGAIARYVPMKGKGASASLAAAIARAGTGTASAAGAVADPAVDFTKRSLGTPAVRRGKPRYLGLVLTVILLLFLAGVAVWSSYFVGDTTTTSTADGDAAVGDAAVGDAAVGDASASDADAVASLDPQTQDPNAAAETAADLGDTAITDATGALIEPPEADATDSVATADAEPVTETPEPAAEATPDPAPEPAPEPAAVADATLSTSDQAAATETPADEAVAKAEVATSDTATATPTEAAVAEPEPQPETASPTTETATTAPAPPEPAETVIAATPVAEPPAEAPQAETDFAALSNGSLQGAGERLPELVGTEPGLQTGSVARLAEPVALAGDNRPDTPLPPAPFGTFFERDANGLVIATPQGAVTPEGALVVAGRPTLVPPPRPERPAIPPDPAAADAGTATPDQTVPQSNPALAGFRPKPRPAAPVAPQDDTALQVAPQIATASTVRPPERPPTPAGFVTDPTATAQAAADTGTLTTASSLATTITRRPVPRPVDLAASVSAALASVEPAAASTDPQPVIEAALTPQTRPVAPDVTTPAAEPEAAAPEADNEPELASAAPAIPQNASVARQATLANAINLGKLNLIGVYGTANNRHALVRLASGRYVRVKVGDRVDGGQVAAIGEQELRYIKNGRNVVLSLPKDS